MASKNHAKALAKHAEKGVKTARQPVNTPVCLPCASGATAEVEGGGAVQRAGNVYGAEGSIRVGAVEVGDTGAAVEAEAMKVEGEAGEAREAGEATAAEEDEVEMVAWDTSRCLFCSEMRESIDDNLEHMLKEHGFFVPDAEYVQIR